MDLALTDARRPRGFRPATIAARLGTPLERLYRDFDYAGRVDRDAIQFPAALRAIRAIARSSRCSPRASRTGGWISSARALEGVLAAMGPSPAAFVRGFDPARDAPRFARFLYRFNRPRDLVAFCVALRDVLARHGTLERCFVAGDEPGAPHIGPALERFARAFLDADVRALFPRGRLSRGYRHLFPLPSVGGPCKRLHLFLRWMVRRETPDFGLWTSVSPARLLMPDRHARREHEPRDRPHAPALTQLAHGGGDHGAAGGCSIPPIR